jgi:alpha-amylase
MGTRDELRSMIITCRKNGVRVYADAVTNHMTGGGNDVGSHRNGNGGGCAYWGPKGSSDDSPFYTQDFNYDMNNSTGRHPALEYPAVPYGPEDFHCERPLNSWSSPFDLNYGWLVGLSDLNTERANVQDRIAAYMTDLLGIGFSGFRMDAAKHIQPDDLTVILGKFRKNMGGSFPDDFIAYLEVLIGGEKELLECDYSSYNYATYFTDVMKKAGFSDDDVAKVKIWSSDYPKEFPICGSWVIPSTRFAVENDCHDDQNPGSSSRDMGDKGSILVLEKNVPKHRGFEVELFARTDGDWKIRLVLSSYTFMGNGAMGFPDGESDCSKCVGEDRCKGCKSMAYSKAHDTNACGYTCLSDSGEWLEGVYTRVHRDKSIIMAMRKWMNLPLDVSNEDLGLPNQCQEE